MSLQSRISIHAEKVRKQEEMEAALAGVFTREAESRRQRFETLAQEIIKPAFDEFKKALRSVGRDAVIITNLTADPVQSIGVTLLDRYLSFGAGKTVKLVNPKQDLSKQNNTKFYEVFRADDILYIRHRTDSDGAPISLQVSYENLNPKFFEDELAVFFERAYPTQG